MNSNTFTRHLRSAAILSLTAAGLVAGENEREKPARYVPPDNVWTSDVVKFVPGTLTEILTPPSGLDSFELSHGYRFLEDLVPEPCCSADTDDYRISQKPFSSYEVVVDSTSGDIDPLKVDRRDAGGNVLQPSSPIGLGFSRSLRWMNTNPTDVNDEFVRVQSGGCTTDCGPDDVYLIRGYETTYSVPRFNNSGTQLTVLLLQNPTTYTVNGNIYFWDVAGALLATSSFSLGPKQLEVLNTATIPGANGAGGTVTIAHDGRYGDLAAKTVALEPATGFSFDSPALPRLR